MDNYTLASLWRRGLAWWLDLLVICVPPCIWLIGVWSDIGGRYRVEHWYQQYLWQEWLPAAWLVAVLLYYTVCEAAWGATLGKRLLTIAVVREDGSPCGWYQSFVRNLWRFIDALFFWWAGAICIFLTKRKQRIGDVMAQTVVVRKAKIKP